MVDDLPKFKLRVEAPSFIPAQAEPIENTLGDKEVIEAPPTVNPTVKLLRALRLPVIDFSTELNIESSGQSVMFEPAQQELHVEEYGLQLQPSIVEPKENRAEGACTVRLVIENSNAHPVFLPANQLIGHLQPTKCLSQDEATKVLHSQVNFVSSGPSVNSSDFQQRCKAILEMVQVDRSSLQDEECTTLDTLITEYTDIFAVNSAEIGRTDLVQHQINTGDSAPVKQQA